KELRYRLVIGLSVEHSARELPRAVTGVGTALPALLLNVSTNFLNAGQTHRSERIQAVPAMSVVARHAERTSDNRSHPCRSSTQHRNSSLRPSLALRLQFPPTPWNPMPEWHRQTALRG